MELLLIFCEGSYSHIKDVEMWYDDGTKGDVDKGRQEDTQVGHDEVHDEYLLSEGSLVCGCCLVVLKVGKSSSDLGEESVKDGVDRCEDACRDEDLESVSNVLSCIRVTDLRGHS